MCTVKMHKQVYFTLGINAVQLPKWSTQSHQQTGACLYLQMQLDVLSELQLKRQAVATILL